MAGGPDDLEDMFHIDLEKVPKGAFENALKNADSTPQIEEEKALVATAVDPEKVTLNPLMCRIVSAEYGGSHEFKVPIYGTGGHESIQCVTKLNTDDPHTKHVLFPYHINVRGDDWIRAKIVPLQKFFLKLVQDKDAKHVITNPKERGMLRTSHVYIPRAPAETELAVLIERMDEEGNVKETYHGASLKDLLTPRHFHGFGSSRDMVYKKG